MAYLNRITLIGNAVEDVELRYTTSKKAVATLRLCVSRKFSGKEEKLFVECTTWDKQAETLAQYVQRGKELYIEGRLKEDSWEKDGQKRSKLTIVIDNFQFLGRANQKTENNSEPSGSNNNDSSTGIQLDGDIPF